MLKSFMKHTPFGISLIVLFTAILFLVAIVPVFGNKTLIVRTGSMSPTIGVGDLIFVFPKQNYKVGDIIAFNEGGKSQTTITHRIASVKQENGQISYQTKGDSNKLADGTLVPKGNVLGSADYSIRGIGRVFAMVKTKNGFLLTAIFPAALVIILEMVNIARALKKPKVRYAPSVIPKSDIWSEPTTPVIPRSDIWSEPTPPVIPRSDFKSDRGNLFKRLLRFSRNDKVGILMRPQPAAVSAFVYPNPPKIPKLPKNSHLPMGLNLPSVSLNSLFASIFEKINFHSLKPDVGLPYYATSFKALLPYAIVVVIFSGSTFATTYSDSEESKGNSFKAASEYPNQNNNQPPSPNNIVSIDSLPNPSPSPVPGDVIINEINWSGSNSDALDEWIELKNTKPYDINIGNWLVENLGTGSGPAANIAIPSGSIIPANGFFLISAFSKVGSSINVDPDFITSSISLLNGGEQLRLKTDAAVLIDSANQTGAWFSGSNSAPKKSMERIITGDGTSAASWQTALTHTNMDSSGSTDEFGTPKAANGL